MISASTTQYPDDPSDTPCISVTAYIRYLWSGLQPIFRRQQCVNATKQFLETGLQERFLELVRSAIDGVANSSEMPGIRTPFPAPIVNVRLRGTYAIKERSPG
jgi:hypothetical protein